MDAQAVSYAQQALFLVLLLSAPPVLAAMVVGLAISLLQATTQIQEQTLTFVPKMVVVILVLVFFGSMGMNQLVGFTKSLLENFPEYIVK